MTFYEMARSEPPMGGAWRLSCGPFDPRVPAFITVNWSGFEWRGYLSEVLAVPHSDFWGRVAALVNR